MSKRLAVVAVAATAFMGLAITQAPAGKKHSHATIQKYAVTSTYTAPFDVGGGVATCPAGSVVTGGGVDYVDGIGHVAYMGLQGSNAYYALVDNFDYSIGTQVDVQVACTAGTSKAKGRVLSEAAAEKMLEQKIAELEAAHREAR